MASIQKYQTKSGTKWRIRVLVERDELTGKELIKTKQGFNSKKEAKLVALKLETVSMKLPKPVVKLKETGSSITFNEVYQEWFSNYKLTVKESTWIKTREIFRLHILPIFGKRNIDAITDDLCQKSVNKWYHDGFTKFKVWINNVSRVFRYAKRKHLITNNPVEDILIPKQSNVRIRTMANNFYDKSELHEFLDHLHESSDYQAYTFFRLLAFSGMRKGEALALNWNDIDFRRETVSITKTQSRGIKGINIQTPKTYESNREIFLDSKTIDALKTWRKIQASRLRHAGFCVKSSQLVFSNSKNTMWQPLKPLIWLNRVIKKYNLKHITCHGFRHTYATLAFEAGLSVKQVQLQLGHKDIQTTLDIYIAVTKKQKSEIANKFSAYVDF